MPDHSQSQTSVRLQVQTLRIPCRSCMRGSNRPHDTLGPGECRPSRQANWNDGAAWTTPLQKSFMLEHNLPMHQQASGACPRLPAACSQTNLRRELVTNQRLSKAALHNNRKGHSRHKSRNHGASEQKLLINQSCRNTSQWAGKHANPLRQTPQNPQ